MLEGKWFMEFAENLIFSGDRRMPSELEESVASPIEFPISQNEAQQFFEILSC